MEKGQKVTVTIEDMSGEGQGIGRAEGLVVFVPDTVVGDVAEAELTKVKKNYAFSRLVEIVEPSTQRSMDFDCEFYSEGCGGCPYGMLDYEAQLKLKESQVRQKIQRLAGIDEPVIRPIIGMEAEDNMGFGAFRYRNKAQFPVSTGGIITRKGGIVENLGEPAVGFYRAKSHEVVDCGDCYLQSMAAMAAADALRQFMEEDNITAYDPKWDKGLIRHLIVKTAFATREVMVVIVVNGKGIPNAQKLVELLDDAVYEVGYNLESVVVNVKKNTAVLIKGKKPKKGQDLGKDPRQMALSGEIMGDENIVIAGKKVIVDEIGDLKFEISPSSFYQVNPVQMKRLYDKVKEYCGFDGVKKHVILDLYCGVGSIGLYCADQAEAIVGIEIVKEAVTDANRNAVINGIVNARYICGKAEEILPQYVSGSEGIDKKLADQIRRADIAILDPPRSGCRPELLEAVAHTDVERIVYVSCDPATLARDIKLLGEMGYEFVEATPVDMFPHTSHVEVVTLLVKAE